MIQLLSYDEKGKSKFWPDHLSMFHNSERAAPGREQASADQAAEAAGDDREWIRGPDAKLVIGQPMGHKWPAPGREAAEDKLPQYQPIEHASNPASHVRSARSEC